MSSSVTLQPREDVCWHADKAVTTHVIPMSPPSTAVPPPAGDFLLCLAGPKRVLEVWSPTQGLKRAKGADEKYTTHVLSVASDGPWSGLFTERNSGRNVGFAIVQHETAKPHHLSKTQSYAKEVQSLMAGVVNSGRQQPTANRSGVPWVVCQSRLRCLRQGGHVVAALVRLLEDDRTFLIMGHLAANTWHRREVLPCFATCPCLLISDDGRHVSIVCSELRTPLDYSLAVDMPSVLLALSSFELVEEASVHLSTPVDDQQRRCLLFRQIDFTDIESKEPSVSQRLFQSHSFVLPNKNTEMTMRPCQVDANVDGPALFTVLIDCQGVFLIHLSHSIDHMKMVSHCHTLGAMPAAIATVTLPCAKRPEGARLTFTLSASCRLNAYEAWGSAVQLTVLGEGHKAGEGCVTLQAPLATHYSKRYNPALTTAPQLVSMPKKELVCSNGLVAAFLQPAHVELAGDLMPAVCSVARGVHLEDRTGGVLSRSLARLAATASAGRNYQEVADAFFGDILPSSLPTARASQQSIFLVQRLYASLLEMLSPASEAEWRHLWTLTRAVQQTLSQRVRDSKSVYTDAFFLQLARQYVEIKGDETVEAKAVIKSLAELVSDELKSVLQNSVELSTSASYVLQGLASGAPLDVFAEEIVRRFIFTTTLSNGACAIHPQQGSETVPYVVGLSLLASCLDIPLYVECGVDNTLTGRLNPGNGTSVHVPVQGFNDQRAFERALVLAGDLLAVQSPSTSLPWDATLLAFGVARRSHCFAAFVHLMSPVIRTSVQRLNVSDNIEWMRDCLRNARLSPDAYFRTLLSTPASDGRLASTVCYSLGNSETGVDEDCYRAVHTAVSMELGVASIVVLLFTATDRLIAAQNNYTTSVMKYLLSGPLSDTSQVHECVLLCRERLLGSIVLVSRLWGRALSLLPYSLHDMMASYQASVVTSRRCANSPSEGTVLSRTLVTCFRVYVLVYYAHLLEQRLDRSRELCRKAASGAFTEFHPAVDGCLQALFVLYTLASDVLPREWFHWKLLSMVREATRLCVSPQTRPWNAFFMAVLDEAGVERTSISHLKRAHYACREELSGMVSSEDVDANCQAVVTRYMERARRLIDSLAVAERVGEEPTAFSLSHSRNATTPPWSAPDTDRQYYVNVNWTDNLWKLEEMEAPRGIDTATILARLTEEIEKAKVQPDPSSKILSPVLQRPLYDAICQIAPPVRSHTIPLKPLARVEAVAPVPPTAAHSVATFPPSTPEKAVIRAPPGTPGDVVARQERPSPLAKSEAAAVSPLISSPLPASTPVRGPLSTINPSISNQLTNETPPAAKSVGATPLATEQKSRLATHQLPEAIPVVQPVGLAKFTPQDVAWWEVMEARQSHKGNYPTETPTAEDAALSDTATSYTTTTSVHQSEQSGVGRLPSSWYAGPGDYAARPPKKYCQCKRRRAKSPVRLASQLQFPHPLGLQLLQSPRGLQPPQGYRDYPQTARLVGRPTAHSPRSALDANGEISLLSFGRSRNAKPFRLYIPPQPEEAAPRPVTVPDVSPSFAVTPARTSVRQLDPPGLPASAVMQMPPPLLHLSIRRAPAPPSSPASPGEPPERPPSPSTLLSAPPLPTADCVTFAATADVRPYAQVPREMPTVSVAAVDKTTRPAEVVTASMATPPVRVESVSHPPAPFPAVAFPVAPFLPSLPTTAPSLEPALLSPSELADFRQYTEDLLMKRKTTFAPVPVFPQSNPPQLATTPTASHGAPQTCITIESVAEQQNAFMQRVTEMLRQKESEDKALQQSILSAVRSLPVSRPGLSTVEQSQLIENSIKQKNELLNLNHTLLDLQLQAARGGSCVNTAAPPTSDTFTSVVSPAVPKCPAPSVPIQVPTLGAATQTVAPPLPRVVSTEAQTLTPCQGSKPTPEDPRTVRSMASAMSDLHRFNVELMSINTSAEAMEKAIEETRSAIRHYEGMKAVAQSSVEGAAFLNALRCKTTDAERQLARLPHDPSTQQSVSRYSCATWDHHNEQRTPPEPRRPVGLDFLAQSTTPLCAVLGETPHASLTAASVEHPTESAPATTRSARTGPVPALSFTALQLPHYGEALPAAPQQWDPSRTSIVPQPAKAVVFSSKADPENPSPVGPRIFHTTTDLNSMYRTAARRPSASAPLGKPKRTTSVSISTRHRPPSAPKRPAASFACESRYDMYCSKPSEKAVRPKLSPSTVPRATEKRKSIVSRIHVGPSSVYEVRQRDRRDTNIAKRMADLAKEFTT